MAILIKKRRAKRKVSHVLGSDSRRKAYLDRVTSVSRGFEEIFSDYHLNPALFSSIKSGLNEGWIKREYINKKFESMLDKVADNENLPFYMDVLEKAVKEKVVTRNYAKNYLHKRVKLTKECNHTLYAIISGEDVDINMAALQEGIKSKLIDPVDLELAINEGIGNRLLRSKQDYKFT